MRKAVLWTLVYLILAFGLFSCGSSTSNPSGASSLSKAITAYSFSSPQAIGTINESNKTIQITVPYGTDVTRLVATFTTTGANVKVGGAVQVSGTTPNNFTNPVVYTVSAADGSMAEFTVTVTVALNSAKSITSFSLLGIPGAITESTKTINLSVPYGTNVTGLVATFTTTGANVKVGGAVQVSGTTPNNFTNPVVYTVTAADDSTAEYTVTVTVALNSAKSITSFSLLGIPGAITESTKTITLSVPYGTNVTGLVATFTTTGANVKVGGTIQVSGTTPNNFTSPVVYTVSAADGSMAEFTVTVTVALNSAKSITSFSILGIPGSVNESAKTVTLAVPYGTDVTGLVATFTTTGANIKVGGTIQVSGTTPNNFTNPVVYTLSAADGSTTQYTVAVTVLTLPSNPLTWIWTGGSNTINQTGVYGTKGIASASNMPGAREHLMSCTDTNGDFWLFGGGGYDATQGGELNDLWKFDGANWTWVSGADTVWQAGIYGTKGIGAASNVPGARYDSELWCDKNGNLWLFGGGHEVGGVDCYNDLWKFDGANWTWVSGSDTTNQTGVYGTKGIASPANVPGSRLRATSWSDSYGNLWLFGGEYYVGNTSFVYFNDLWKYDGTNWTWVSGSDTTNQKGVYGTKGIPSATNVPGARSDAIAWIDQNDNLWLFGGGGYDSEGNGGGLNDLWKFDGTNWTWVSGADIGVWQGGIYGTKGIASASNIPGSRRSAPGSVDNSGNFWLFGGYGIDSAGNGGYLNDIWKFDGTNWTWIGGPDIVDQPGVYGIQGAASASNVPGARARFASWTDKSGNFWLFGGRTGYYSDAFNDLWFFQVE